MEKQVIPNIMAPFIVQSTLAFAWASIANAALSILGLGTQTPTPSWGTMLIVGRQIMDQSKTDVVFGGAAIVLAVLRVDSLGNGLRDVLDPRI